MTDGQSEACELNGPWATHTAWKPHVYAVIGDSSGEITYVLRRRDNKARVEYWGDGWGVVYMPFATATEAEAKLAEILAAERKTYGDSDYLLALQRAIEWHCRGELVPQLIAEICPIHADQLNRNRVSGCSLTQSHRERIAALLETVEPAFPGGCESKFYEAYAQLLMWRRDAWALLREIAG